jgi:hypothetical protein
MHGFTEDETQEESKFLEAFSAILSAINASPDTSTQSQINSMTINSSIDISTGTECILITLSNRMNINGILQWSWAYFFFDGKMTMLETQHDSSLHSHIVIVQKYSPQISIIV